MAFSEVVLAELIDVSREITDQDVRESLQQALVSAQEDAGWKLLAGFDRDTGPSIEQVHTLSQTARAFLAGNPMAKRATRLRVGYIWGGGVDFGKGRGVKQIVEKNTDRFFSIDGYEEYEQTLATDGNFFTLLDPQTKRMQNIPLGEITGFVTAPADTTEVMYWQRVWIEQNTDAEGKTSSVTKKMYFPAIGNDEKNRTRIGTTGIDNSKRIHHAHVNRQSGWVLGVPDLFVVTLWVTAYKAFLEGGQQVNQALTRIAWKVTAASKAGSQRAAAAIASQSDPTLPPTSPYGATANLTGLDLAAVSRTGAMIDFDAARALAALVAAGMEVPLTALLSDSSGSGSGTVEASLDNPTVDAMRIRQQKADASYTRRLKYLGVPNPQVIFPPVRSVPVHRMIQAITVGAATGTLSPQSVHKVLAVQLAEYGYVDDGVLPEPGEWADYVKGGSSQPPASPDNPGTPPLNTPNGDNTNTPGRGPADDVGDNGNDVRSDT